MKNIFLSSRSSITIMTALMIVILTLGILFNRISWVDITISGVGIYTTLLILFLLGQFILLAFIDKSSKEIRNASLIIRASRVAIWLSQILLSILVTTLLVEIVTVSTYHTNLLIVTNFISYGVSIVFTGLLTYKFLSWFTRQRNAVTVVYGAASLIILVDLVVTLLFSVTILSSRPDEVRQFLVSSGIFIRQDSFASILNIAYQVSSVAMFIAMWGATAMLLYHYSKRVGKIRFWILVALPLVYFLSQFVSSIQDISMFLVPDPVLIGSVLASIFTISLVVGGILFGIAFIKSSSKFSENEIIRNYLIVAGYGFMFLLISNNAVLLATVPYPPYAILSVAFIGVASYSILVGIYSAAVAASNDVELRKSIRNLALGEGKLLDSIGTAEVQRAIEDRASRMLAESQKYMEEEIGFSPLTKDEVAKHIEVVIKELEEARARKGKSG
jgi:hypothetical protein